MYCDVTSFWYVVRLNRGGKITSCAFPIWKRTHALFRVDIFAQLFRLSFIIFSAFSEYWLLLPIKYFILRKVPSDGRRKNCYHRKDYCCRGNSWITRQIRDT